jgi:3'(2'), 5'-bisphosphate nucleotidase
VAGHGSKETAADDGRQALVTGGRTGVPVASGGVRADDASLAAALAAGAGRVLMALRGRAGTADVPFDGKPLGAAGDAASQAWLAAALAEHRPDDAVLSEEAEGGDARLTADRVWIIDPLDGTREYAEVEPGGSRRTDFAVHVALWMAGRGLVAGAVALPARDLVLDSATVAPVDDAAARAVVAGSRPLRVAASRTRPPAVVGRLAARGSVELVPMGSNGVKVIAVIEGTVDAYVHAGGQYEWDSAAPVVVARAAGLVATRLDGSPLEYNQPDPWSPDLVVCHPALVAHVRRLLAEAGPDDAPGAPA